MKASLFALLLLALFVATVPAQHPVEPRKGASAAAPPDTATTSREGDAQQLRADIQRLQALVNQMRTNLAFVQTSQTPLKHQFELEAAAWQIIIDDMNRRLKHMEENGNQNSVHQKNLP